MIGSLNKTNMDMLSSRLFFSIELRKEAIDLMINL